MWQRTFTNNEPPEWHRALSELYLFYASGMFYTLLRTSLNYDFVDCRVWRGADDMAQRSLIILMTLQQQLHTINIPLCDTSYSNCA